MFHAEVQLIIGELHMTPVKTVAHPAEKGGAGYIGDAGLKECCFYHTELTFP